jgi:probable rRNA maturation factor
VRQELRFRVQVSNRQRRFSVGSGAIRCFCAGILDALDAEPCEVSVAIVGEGVMRDLNQRFRGRDYAADVLSFEYGGTAGSGMPLLGEIAISPAVALRQALRWGTTHDREMRRLLAHGLLHLLGYDHTRDKGEHLALQRRLLRRRFAGRPPAMIERMKRR